MPLWKRLRRVTMHGRTPAGRTTRIRFQPTIHCGLADDSDDKTRLLLATRSVRDDLTSCQHRGWTTDASRPRPRLRPSPHRRRHHIITCCCCWRWWWHVLNAVSCLVFFAIFNSPITTDSKAKTTKSNKTEKTKTVHIYTIYGPWLWQNISKKFNYTVLNWNNARIRRIYKKNIRPITLLILNWKCSLRRARIMLGNLNSVLFNNFFTMSILIVLNSLITKSSELTVGLAYTARVSNSETPRICHNVTKYDSHFFHWHTIRTKLQ